MAIAVGSLGRQFGSSCPLPASSESFPRLRQNIYPLFAPASSGPVRDHQYMERSSQPYRPGDSSGLHIRQRGTVRQRRCPRHICTRLTLSCPDVPPFRFLGTLVSIRCRTVVMCSDNRHIAAVPSPQTIAPSSAPRPSLVLSSIRSSATESQPEAVCRLTSRFASCQLYPIEC